MTDLTNLASTPRDRFMKLAQQEMLAFEKREADFRKRDLKERADKLKLPIDRQ